MMHPRKNDQITVTVAVAMMKSGAATIADIAWLAGISRQLVRHWALRAGINPVATRAAFLARAWDERRRDVIANPPVPI